MKYKCIKTFALDSYDDDGYMEIEAGEISVLCPVKRYQKRSQDLPGVQYVESDAERK